MFPELCGLSLTYKEPSGDVSYLVEQLSSMHKVVCIVCIKPWFNPQCFVN